MIPIRENSLASIEWPKVVALCAARARGALGKARVSGTAPAADLATARERLAETSEARSLLEDGLALPFAEVEDVGPAAARAAKGAILEAAELRAVANTLEAGEIVRRRLREAAEAAPRLGLLGRRIADLHRLAEDLRAAFDPQGRVDDNASPQLARLRAEVRRLSERIDRRVQDMLREERYAEALQDRYFTIREGRYVLPVRTDSQVKVEGIVHGSSGSGATVYVEPRELVDLNNRLKMAQIEEERETMRILQQLSGDVAREADAVAEATEALAEADAIFARGRLSLDLRAAAPELTREPRVRLLGLRHPLLVAAGGEVVASDLALAESVRGLVISGPNTGGKTVTLKALGLAALMVRVGMHVPCDPGSALGLFDPVLAHVGDEQSIEESLSTFSAHMLHVDAILREARRGALVLLDELATGTDPREGEALAIAVLDELIDRGATVLATTHYGAVKAHAAARPELANASVAFDPETLRPTYRLRIGAPGPSYAREIARRLGVDPKTIHRADETMAAWQGEAERKADRLLADLEEDRRRLAAEREEVAGLRAEAEEARAALSRKEAALAEREARLVGDQVAEATAEIAEAREEVRRLTAELVRTRSLDKAREGREQLARIEARLARLSPESAAGGVDPASLRPGDRVRIRSLGKVGVVQETGAKEVRVLVGGVLTRTPPADLARLGAPEPARPEAGRDRSGPRPEGGRSALELDLRGERVEDALRRLDRFLDDALRAGLDRVRVIHGHGTGALKAEVRRFLADSPHVARRRPGGPGEGGDGVTIVDLR